MADALQLGLEFVEKQRLDQLEDVALAGVVRAQVAARFRIHHRLEQGSENRRADAAPVQCAGVQQQLPHAGVERRQRQRLGEQPAVDVGQFGKLRVQRFLALRGRGVQRLEQLRQPRTDVAAVGCAAPRDQLVEGQARKDAGVVGEQAEQQPHQ